MKNFKLLITVLCSIVLLFSTMDTLAQRTVTGKVLDGDTGKPIQGIQIKVKGVDITVKSDINGKYSITVPDSLEDISFQELAGRKIKKVEIIGPNEINLILSRKELDYFEMSLEDLINAEITTISKKSQKISEAPGIIDVYTSKQISDMGIDNLYELLSTLPGIEIMETYYGYTDVQFRGILQSHYNNKSSLLLNGQPLYDQVVSCYYLEQIPLSSIERIEVVRGPGGVLYGTNAYAGVINIITKKGGEIDGAQMSFKAGQFNTKNASFALGKEIKELDMFFAGEFNESDGYEKEVEWDEDDVNPLDGSLFGSSNGSRILGYYPDDPDAYENDYTNFFTSLGYKGLTMNANYFYNEKDKFGLIPTLCSTGERILQGYGFNLKYNTSLMDDKMGLTSIVWHDQISKKERVNAYFPVLRAPHHPDDQDYGGNKTGMQLELNYQLSDKISILGGGGFEASQSDPYYFFYTDSTQNPLTNDVITQVEDKPANAISSEQNTSDIWFFAQANIYILDNLNLVAGSRLNSNKQAGTAFIPNVGIVYSPLKDLSLKVLYGSGYRNPSIFEKYVRTVGVLAGVEDLEPEKINTVDIGIDYSFSNYSIRINGFYTKTDMEISRRALDSLDLVKLNSEEGYGTGSMEWKKGAIYENKEGNTYQGIEMSFQGVPTSYLLFKCNLSYKFGKDADDNDLNCFAPILANLGITIKPVKKISISGNLQYISEREIHYKAMYPWNTWPEGDHTIDSYTLISAKLSFLPQENLAFSLIGKNLMDVEYNYPEYIRKGIPYIPGGPGRALYFEIGYRF
ncbi:MAG: TonB-dependent receptor [Bacteroidales bacterium]|nr:TonB-dependent receptor [Bacteroidales bacterium]